MKKKLTAIVLAAAAGAAMLPNAYAANESWRDPMVTRIMKTISQDPSYTDAVLTDLDRNGIPEAFVIRKGAFGKIGAGYTMINNVMTQLEVPTDIIGECLENIDVYLKNDNYIFVGAEVPRYASYICYYKLTLDGTRLNASRINKDDVSPYTNIAYVDKYSSNLLENGFPNRSKISDFVDSFDMVNSVSASLSSASIRVNGDLTQIGGYTVNDSNYFKIRDIAMLLRSTSKRFNVVWDSELEAIQITPGEDYTVIGGELSNDTADSIEVVENNTPIYVFGKRTAITAYNINGSSYFKIRDIADAAGFDVQWDGDSQTINIVTE